MELLVLLDYWAERYQTIIAALLAFVGVYFAVVPAWRQLAILEAQRTDQIRERLAARYRMLAKAIELMDPEAWRRDVPFALRPEPEQFDDPEFRRHLLEGFETRKQVWAKLQRSLLKLELLPSARAIVDRAIESIEVRIRESEENLSPQAIASREERHGGRPMTTELWFHAAEAPDMMVIHRFDMARKELEAEQGAAVDAMVAPPKR